jgi:hypothetical protein
MKGRFLVAFVLLLIPISTAFGQGVQTATLEGTVTDQSGTPLPGVTITVSSPAMMGERTAVTTGTGDYNLRGLPPGEYRIRFSLEGMKANEVKKTLALGVPTRVDAQMRVAAVAEAITVTAAAPSVLETSTVGTNIKKEQVEELPLLRTPTDIASLSPGVTGDRGGRATTPVAGQISINGGMAYDNNFMINGVNFQDNIFGNTNNLFVEDAIQETQVLASGISAEYGHFTGGVLNVITKSGGNTFQGTFRDNMNKGSWLALTPYEKGFRGVGVANAAIARHTAKLSHIYEATLGGPILRDRIWFFAAGRKEKSSTPNSLTLTAIPYNVQQGNKRPELKLTVNIGSGHTLQGDWIDNPVTRNLEVQVTPLTMSAVGTNSVRENRGYSAFYSGVLATNLFAEARYSAKHFGFRGLGGKSTNIVDSPFRSSTRVSGVTSAGTFNAPYFDATDPEDRNNRQAFAAMSYFMSRPTWGSHDLKGGIERFTDERTGGNSQTATGYVFFGGYKNNAGVPVLVNGELVPLFNPCTVPCNNAGGATQATRLGNYIATRGAKLDTTTDSLFINDRWNLNSFLSFNLGARYEKTKASATGGIIGVDTSNFVPRLGASYDPMANGKFKIDVTYAQYVGRYNPAIIGANTPVGSPSLLYGYYIGPRGEGRDFAPGFNPANYKYYFARVPTANVFFDKGLHAPISNEWTVSGGVALPKSGWVKATLANRNYTQFLEDFILIQYGNTPINLNGVSGVIADNKHWNNSNIPERKYQALELQSHYDLTRNWGIEGNWTHQLKNHGNYEGESGQSIGATGIGDYPEMQSPREIPYGRLAQFEADRVRLWTTYNLSLGRFGSLGTGLLYRYDSPLTFSYSASVARSTISTSKNPGYKGAGSSVGMFWGERGAGEYNATSLFDASLQWSIPIMRLTPWIKFDVRNVFNKDTLIAYNTTIFEDATSALDSMGYRTGFTKENPTTKVITFGRPRGTTDYVNPRQYLVYAGLRF